MIPNPDPNIKNIRSLTNGLLQPYSRQPLKFDKLSYRTPETNLLRRTEPKFSSYHPFFLSPQYSEKNLTRKNSLSPQSRPISNLRSFYCPTNSSGNIIYSFYPLNINCSLYVLQKCLSACRQFLKNHGEISLSLDLIQIDESGHVELKFNPLCHRKTSNESEAISYFVTEIKKLSNCKFCDFYLYLARSSNRLKIDLKTMSSLIKSYAKCSKIRIARSLIQNKSNPLPKSPLTKKQPIFNLQTLERQPVPQRFSVQQAKSEPEQSSKEIHKSSVFSHKNFQGSNGSEKNLLIKEQKETKDISPQFTITIHQPKIQNNRNKVSFTSSHTIDSVQNNDACTPKTDTQWGIVSFDLSGHSLFINPQEEDTLKPPKKDLTVRSILKNSNLQEVVSIGSSLSVRSGNSSNRKMVIETEEDEAIQKKAKEILKSNCWTINVQNLLSVSPILKQSLVVGNDEKLIPEKLDETLPRSRLWLKETLQSKMNDSIRVE